MKAVIFKEHGGLEKLEYLDIPDPQIKEDEVLVQVKACALNHLDIWVRQGVPSYKIGLPHVSGSDVSGEVVALGPRVQGIKERTRVIIAPGISCFQCDYCLSGHDNMCQTYTILGAGTDGGYAQFVKVKAINIISIPDQLTFEDAAAFPLTFLTAWHMLITRSSLQAGQTVLIHAAGSGIGSAAIQIAKFAGARVFATSGTNEKCQKAKLLGADEVINYTQEDFSKKVRQFTHGRGVDVVFEHVGPETWSKSIESLAKNGKVVTCGATTGGEARLDLRYVFSRQLSVLGSMMGLRSELVALVNLIAAKKLTPVIDTIFSLEEARKAQGRILDRKNFGKILLIP